MNRRVWTIEEDNYIKDNIYKLTFKEMASHLNCAIQTVERRAEQLGFSIEYKTARRWTEEEIELLKLMAPKYLNKTIAKKLDRRIDEVNKKARELGIELIFKRPVWKKWKIKFLKENINLLPITRIQEELEVNYYQIMDKLDELGIEYKSPNWTDEEENILRELAPRVYITEIAKVLNRSAASIRTKAHKMGIDYITLKREYTEEELKYIKDNWGKIPITDMARTLKVSRTSVQTQADNMGLKRLGNNPYKKWTQKNIEKLRELSKTKTITELAKYFKTTNTAIITVAYRNNISLIDGKVRWTDEANQELIRLSKTCDLQEISKIMNRSTSSIRLEAERIGIKIMANKKTQDSIWTDENTKELLELATRGETLLSISNIMHKNDETIAKKARELGIKIKRSEQIPWTDEEIKEFKQKAETMTLSELQKEFGRTRASLKNLARRLNIKLKPDKKSWTEDDYKLLQKLVEEDKLTVKEIALIMDRSEDAIIIKINRRGLTLHNREKRVWTKEEETLLSDLWGYVSLEKLAKKLNRTVSAIHNKANLLGLGSYLESNYDGLTIKDISSLLNIDPGTISVAWISLGLKYKVKKISETNSYRYVEISDLYDFLEANQNIWDSRNLERNILGKEPVWLEEKRKRDKEENPEYERLKLTKQQLVLAKKFFLELETDDEDKKVYVKK